MSAIIEAVRPLTPKTCAVPDGPLLVAPKVADLLSAVDGTVVSGDSALVNREVISAWWSPA